MRSRIEMLFLAAVLASALAVACGEDEDEVTCEDYCDKAIQCGETDPEDGEELDRDECIRACKQAELPQEFLACAVELDCEPTDEEALECFRKIPPTPACSTGCEKLVDCMEADAENLFFSDARNCASMCTLVFPEEIQQCLASKDDCSEIVGGWPMAGL